MLEYLKGTLISIHPTHLVIETNKIGYIVIASTPYHWSDQIGQEIEVYCELVVREDAMTLYGFKSESEKKLFQTLNKVSGIGPKSALSILAADDNEGLVQAIESADSTYLTKFPGVGKKTANQIILDLKGELQPITDETAVPDSQQKQIHEEILEALSGLGYSKREVTRVEKQLKSESFDSVQTGLSYAFKLLLKK